MVRELNWAPSIGLSWQWGLASFFVFVAARGHDWLSVLGFALAYVIGLIAFAWLLGSKRRDPGLIFKAVQSRYTGLFLTGQMLSVAATIYVAGAYVFVPLLGLNSVAVVALLVLLATSIGHASSAAKLKRIHASYLAIGVSAILLILLHSPTHWHASAAMRKSEAYLTIPALIGLLVGPWTDARQWLLAVTMHREGRSVRRAYGYGALVFVASLLFVAAMTWTAEPGIGVPDFGNKSLTGTVAGAPVFIGLTPTQIACLVWAAVAIMSAVDSFYVATSWLLKATTATSNSALFALIPVGLVVSPVWFLSTAAIWALCAALVGLPVACVMVPFGTLLLGPAVCLICETLGGRHRCDAVLCVMIGLAAVLVFVIGDVGGLPMMVALSPMIGVIGALPAIQAMFERSTPVPVTSVLEQNGVSLPIQTIKLTPSEAVQSHGFDGQWFVLHLTPTYDDTNVVGNVYFANYFRWVGKARELFFNACMPDFDLQTTGFYILTKSFSHEFRREIREFHPVSVRVKIGSYNRKFVTIVHEILSESDGLIGKGEQSIMFVDPAQHRPLDIPPIILQRFLPYYTPNAPVRSKPVGAPHVA